MARKNSNGLTDKQQLCADIFLGRVKEHVDCAGSQIKSYKAAGYAAKGNAAVGASARLFRENVQLRAYLEKQHKALEGRMDKTQDDVARKLANVAFSRMSDVVKWGPGGVELKDMSEVPDHALDAVAEVSTTRVETLDAEGRVVRVRTNNKIKLHDPNKAAELYGKHIGMWPNKLSVDLTTIRLEDMVLAEQYGLPVEEFMRRRHEGTLPSSPRPAIEGAASRTE